MPAVKVSTVPVATILEVRSPSSKSVEVAPRSVKIFPIVILRGSAPKRVITGAWFCSSNETAKKVVGEL